MVPVLAILAIFALILLLVPLSKRIGVAYPIVLLLGGVAVGYIPGFPTLTMPPELVLVVFLPPLLYWESVTAPASEFRNSAWWIFQLAFGLVIVTTAVVAVVTHALVPVIGWGAAFVFGAIVSSTDEVAFAPIIDRLPIPRHVVATIEGESLVNDATSLVLYGVAVAAVVTGTFSLGHTAVALVLSVAGGIALGVAAGCVAVLAWHFTDDPALQALISISAPYLAYIPAQYHRRIRRSRRRRHRSLRAALYAARAHARCARARDRVLGHGCVRRQLCDLRARRHAVPRHRE